MKIEDPQLLKRIIEGVLMAAEKPLNKRAIKELFDDLERPDDALIDQTLEELQNDCEGRGYALKQVASGYRYQVEQELSKWVSKLWKERTPRYSRALLETLSLIAYRQPITRGEIESIRGVAVSSNIIRTLLEREWIKAVGYRDVPGRPAIYATTKQFLDYFNLKSLDQLPPLAEVRDLNTISREFNIEMPAEMEAAESANDADIIDDEAEADLAEGVISTGHTNEAGELDVAVEDNIDVENLAEDIAADIVENTVEEAIESNEPNQLSEQHDEAEQSLSDLELVGRNDGEERAKPAADESAAFGNWLESELSDNASAAE